MAVIPSARVPWPARGRFSDPYADKSLAHVSYVRGTSRKPIWMLVSGCAKP